MTDNYQKEFLRAEYKSRINRVQDYIDNNLNKDLTLATLAEIANFSPYHFHRIFGAMTGEPLNKYIQRIRLEKAAILLLTNPRLSIMEVAMENGFTNQSAFAKAFKKTFQLSASQWRESKNGKMESKENKLDDKFGKAPEEYFSYNSPIPKNNEWRYGILSKLDAKVDVREISEKSVVYLRHTGPYKGDEKLFGDLIEKLCRWAGPRGLMSNPETQMFVIYHDSPEITEEDKLRISVCLTAPEDMVVDGDIGKMTVAGGKYAVGHFELSSHQYEEAWNTMYAGWLPESGFQPHDRPPFEHYLNNPEEHPEKKCIVDICIPVKPL